MGIKFPKLFGNNNNNNPKEPLPSGQSAAKLLDKRFGVGEHTFYQQQVALVQKDLEFLRDIEPKKYELLTMELEDAQKARTEPMQDILNFMEVIHRIKGTRIVTERVMVDTEITRLARDCKKSLNVPYNMTVLNDNTIKEYNRLVQDRMEGDEEIYIKEEELLSEVPEWKRSIEYVEEAYTNSLIAMDYRIALLQLMNDLLHHSDKELENPFISFEGKKADYIKYLSEDIFELSERMRHVMTKYGDNAKSDSRYTTMVAFKKDLDFRMAKHRESGEDSEESRFGYETEDTKSCFFKVARKYVETLILLNQIEYAIEMDKIDKKVRQDAEVTLHGGISREQRDIEISYRLKEFGVADDAYRYQLGIAREMGLINGENFILSLPDKVYHARAIFSMIQKAEETGEDILVFSPQSSRDNDFFHAVVKHKLRKSGKLAPPFVELPNDCKSKEFMDKFPKSSVEAFHERLNACGVDDSKIKSKLYYTFDEDTGIYNFFLNTKKGALESEEAIEALRTKIREAGRETSEELKSIAKDKGYPNCMYPFFAIPPKENMIPVLEDLKEAEIRFFFRYDRSDEKMFFYYDPTREKNVEELLCKYRNTDKNNWWSKKSNEDFHLCTDESFQNYLTTLWHDCRADEVFEVSRLDI